MTGKKHDTDSPEDKPKDLANRLAGMVFVAATIAAFVVGIYIVQFGGALSPDMEHWGLTGDYIGGILNPVFGFLALIALLMTIALQSKELAASREELKHSRIALQDSKNIATRQAEHFETQAKKEDVYRMIKDVFEELQVLFIIDTNKVTLAKYVNKDMSKATSMNWRYFFGEVKEQNQYHFILDASNEAGHGNYEATKPLRMLLVELKGYLQQFEALSGNSIVTDYYKRRYAQVVWDMHEKAYIDVDTVDYYKTVLTS